jgi:hypothetical protein
MKISDCNTRLSNSVVTITSTPTNQAPDDRNLGKFLGKTLADQPYKFPKCFTSAKHERHMAFVETARIESGRDGAPLGRMSGMLGNNSSLK